MLSYVWLILLFISATYSSDNFKQVRSLPCDLSKITPLPKIHIVGEAHGISPATQERILKAGASGQFLVASEIFKRGAFFPEDFHEAAKIYGGQSSTSKLHGIESHVPYYLTWSYATQLKHYARYKESSEVFSFFLKTLRRKTNSLYSYVLEQMINDKSLNKDNLELVELSRKIKALQKKEEITYKDRVALRRSLSSAGLLQSFLNEHHKRLVSTVNTKYPNYFRGKKLNPIIDAQSAKAYLGNDLTGIGSGEGNFVLRGRDRDFSYSVGSLICQFHKNERKIIVYVGAAHAKGIQNHLTKISKNRLNFSIHGLHGSSPSCEIFEDCKQETEIEPETVP